MVTRTRRHIVDQGRGLLAAALVAGMAVLLQSPVAVQERTSRGRGIWVWATDPLLHVPAERRAFFDFCRRYAINVAGVSIHTDPTHTGRRLSDPGQWSVLLAEGRRRGMRLHALDGDPAYALRSQHDKVLAIVDAVISYNASVSPDARFHGIHFDIEPYLLPEWKKPDTRERLLADYLDLNERAARRARAAGLVYGVDIPFWWQSIDDITGEAISMTTFHGVRKTATEHLLTIVDNVGIMAYRDLATGPGGITGLALDTLELADRIGKSDVFVGIETEEIREGVPRHATFADKTVEELQAAVNSVEKEFVGRPSFAGVAVHSYVTLRRLEERQRK